MTYQIEITTRLSDPLTIGGKPYKGESFLEYMSDQLTNVIRMQRTTIPRIVDIRHINIRHLESEMDKDIMRYIHTFKLRYHWNDAFTNMELKLWRNPITFHAGTTAYSLTKWGGGAGGTYTPITQIDRVVGTASGVDHLFIGTTDYVLAGTTIDWTPAGTDPDDSTIFYSDYRYTET
jgi:hypothetical protein